MSYLSRRMREDGWPRRNPGELKVTISCDVSKAKSSFARVKREIAELAERHGFALEPWQEDVVEAMYAKDEAGRWRLDREDLGEWPGRGEVR